MSPSPDVTEIIDRFFGSRETRPDYPPVFMFGNSAMSDEAVYAEWLSRHPEVGCIISPRSTDTKPISGLRELFGSRLVLLGEAVEREVFRGAVIVIDDPRCLAEAYACADIIYLGGGFDNCLIPVSLALSRPAAVILGPDYRRDPVADDLRILGGAVEVSSAGSFMTHAGRLLYDVVERRKRARWAAEYAAELRTASNSTPATGN